jgi:hypothetical protein
MADKKELSPTKTWLKHWLCAKSRCGVGGKYKQLGVVFALLREDVYRLWQRDKAYLMERPSLDRIDTCGNYAFSNCRFIELATNRRRPRAKPINCKNKYKGVRYQADHKKYRVIVVHNGKEIHCGYFSNQDEAAVVYNKMASKLFNENININKVEV